MLTAVSGAHMVKMAVKDMDGRASTAAHAHMLFDDDYDQWSRASCRMDVVPRSTGRKVILSFFLETVIWQWCPPQQTCANAQKKWLHFSRQQWVRWKMWHALGVCAPSSPPGNVAPSRSTVRMDTTTTAGEVGMCCAQKHSTCVRVPPFPLAPPSAALRAGGKPE